MLQKGVKEIERMHPENYTEEQVKNIIQAAPTEEMRCCFAMLYAFGVRVTELLSIRAENMKEIKDKKGRKVLRIHTITLKNRIDHSRYLGIDYEHEGWLIDFIMDYVKAQRYTEEYPNIINRHRSTIFRWCKEYAGFHPHFWRSLRLTNLVQKHNFTDQHLTKFAGWTDSKPAKAYIRLRVDDIIPR